MPALRLQQASFAQGSHTLLHEIDLSIEERHSYALLGVNGAGKSSLLRAIKGLLPLVAGSAEWHPDYAPEQQALAGQKPDLLPRSAWENLKFVAGSDHTVLNRAISICEHLDLLGEIHEPVLKLSFGKQQQMNLVRALMFNPTLLLLDEPFAALDVRAINLSLELLEDYRRENTLILSTHSPASVRKSTDSVIFIDQGRVLEVSPQSKFWQNPKSNAARRFLREFK